MKKLHGNPADTVHVRGGHRMRRHGVRKEDWRDDDAGTGENDAGEEIVGTSKS